MLRQVKKYSVRIWGAPQHVFPYSPKFFNYIHFFFGKFGKIVCCPPRRVGVPSYGESWIRPWHLIKLTLNVINHPQAETSTPTILEYVNLFYLANSPFLMRCMGHIYIEQFHDIPIIKKSASSMVLLWGYKHQFSILDEYISLPPR